MKRSVLLVLALCLAAALIVPALGQDDDADVAEEDDDYAEKPERAYLLVRRYIKEPQILEKKPATVVVEVYNKGDRCDWVIEILTAA